MTKLKGQLNSVAARYYKRKALRALRFFINNFEIILNKYVKLVGSLGHFCRKKFELCKMVDF